MRPVKLKMTAFGPYARTIELDFDKGLGGENFFLIHGETGAGKTSILDAICYALYGDSSGGERNDKMLRATQASPSAVTEVEFEFAIDDRFYTVCRRPALDAKTKRAAELFLNGRLLTASYAEVDERVKDILGFEIKQFRQVVVLPQGNFRKFLTANARERGDVLSTIFDADFYALIESRLKDKAGAAKKICDELSAQHKILADSSREFGSLDAKILAENLAAAKKILAQRETDLNSAVEKLTAGERLNAQFDARATAENNLRAAQAELEKVSAEFNAAKTEYDARNAEDSTRRALEVEIAEIQKISDALAELDRQKSKLAAAEKNERSAQENLNRLKADVKNYEKRLENLKRQEENLRGADADFVTAAQKLKDSQARQDCLDKIARLERDWAQAQKIFNAAKIKLDRLQTLQKLCTAAKMAQTLKDGEPCPVCGSIHHPSPAFTEETIPTDEEIKDAEQDFTAASNSLAKISANLESQREILAKIAVTLNVAEAKKIFDDAKKRADELKDCRERLLRGQELTAQLTDNAAAAEKDLQAKTRAAENLRGIVTATASQILPQYLDNPQKISADLRAKQNLKKNLDASWNAAQKNFQLLSNRNASCAGKLQSAEKNLHDAAAAVADKVKPDLAALSLQKNLAQDAFNKAVAQTATLENNLSRLIEISRRLAELSAQLSAAEKNFQIWNRLSEVANGTRSKLTFQRYYLDAIFSDVISEANERLERMSGGRYSFRGEKNAMTRRKLEGLNLEIIDAYNGTARAIETLSGGESFLASLSLALGLAAVVKNTAGGIKLDTIFIDEGFGSLDSETLDVAMSALMDLQEGGRLVGIISHVDAIKNRVPVRLEVTKTKTGSTARFVS
ncbi:MAG: SMC family ATPase [Selenomonadaceae bacterium]|nr:SMC family ATPase [Selenomonadaceae bacterium]